MSVFQRIGGIGLLISLIATPVIAIEQHWQDNSLTYLYGDGYELEPEKQQIVTYEHVSGWSFGDVFIFVDYIDFLDTQPGEDDDAFYGEISPRFSVSKLAGTSFKKGVVDDLLLTTTYEFGSDGAGETWLYGPAIDLRVPGFDFLQLNFYYRDPVNNQTEGFQFTPVWSITWPVGHSEIVFDGYADWVFKSTDRGFEENLLFNPQLSYNLGKAIWGEHVRLKVGIEYNYWDNKFGVDIDGVDSDQSVTSLMVKYHF